MLSNTMCGIIIGIVAIYCLYKLFDRVLFPIIVDKRTKEIEKNPNWITPKLRKDYYGFQDIDIISVEDPFECIPRFRIAKDGRYQLLISNDTSVKDIDDVARLALAGKIRLKYNLWYPEKSSYWLSILCYMLDGGDVRQAAVSWEEANKKDNKPIDDISNL